MRGSILILHHMKIMFVRNESSVTLAECFVDQQNTNRKEEEDGFLKG